jgi:hypothetical protein
VKRLSSKAFWSTPPWIHTCCWIWKPNSLSVKSELFWGGSLVSRSPCILQYAVFLFSFLQLNSLQIKSFRPLQKKKKELFWEWNKEDTTTHYTKMMSCKPGLSLTDQTIYGCTTQNLYKLLRHWVIVASMLSKNTISTMSICLKSVCTLKSTITLKSIFIFKMFIKELLYASLCQLWVKL